MQIVPNPPRLWQDLARQWFQLDAGLSWAWWRALSLSTWSLPVVWRGAVLDGDRRLRQACKPRHDSNG